MKLKKKVILTLIVINLCLSPVGCSSSGNDAGSKYSVEDRLLNDSGGSDSDSVTDSTSDTNSDADTATDTTSDTGSGTEDTCATEDMNACGGCASLSASIGDTCGDCGEYACNTDGGLDCVTPTPTPTRCHTDGVTRQVCADGQWTNQTSCSTGVCYDGACVSCVPDTVTCDDAQTAHVCDDAGSWASTSCASSLTCVEDLGCVECTPDEVMCPTSTATKTCDASGFWQASTDCSTGDVCAEDLGCVTCTPATFKCTNNSPYECDANGNWESSAVVSCSTSQYCDAATGTCKTVSLHREDSQFELHPAAKQSRRITGKTALEDLLDTAAGFKIG